MTRIVPEQQVGFAPCMNNVGFRGARAEAQDYTRRSDYLAEDRFDSSYRNDEEKDEGVVKSTAKAIGNGVKTFVNMTVDAFARATSEVVIDKAVGKIIGK